MNFSTSLIVSAIGFGLLTISIGYMWNFFSSNPNLLDDIKIVTKFVRAISDLKVSSKPNELLRLLYNTQQKHNLHKLVIAENGNIFRQEDEKLVELNENALRRILELSEDAEISKLNIQNFEKILLDIPITLLRPALGSTRFGTYYYYSVTPEGRAFLESK